MALHGCYHTHSHFACPAGPRICRDQQWAAKGKSNPSRSMFRTWASIAENANNPMAHPTGENSRASSLPNAPSERIIHAGGFLLWVKIHRSGLLCLIIIDVFAWELFDFDFIPSHSKSKLNPYESILNHFHPTGLCSGLDISS